MSALPTWTRIGFFPSAAPVSLTRLSPSALVLATVAATSCTVLLSNIVPRATNSPNRLQFRSRAAHSVRLRNISWRASDNLADSGPVLFTETVDGVFRIWGCVIDEPDFFSLWTSLDIHSSLPKQVPLATCYWRTREMEGGKGTPRGGTEDEFVTVFLDGSVHLTTVSNFDCRPPACLSQTSSVLQESVFPPNQLANFRHTYLLPSRSGPNSFHLIGRCSRGTLVHSRATVPSSALVAASSRQHAFHEDPHKPSVSLVGRVVSLAPTFRGEAVLALGDKGRVQSWELGDDEVITESFVADVGIPPDALIATWWNGRMIATAHDRTLRISKFRHSGRFRHITSLTLPSSGSSFRSTRAFFLARASDDSISTTLVAVLEDGSARTWVYNHALKALEEGGETHLGEVRLAVPLPPRGNEVDEIALLAVNGEGTLRRWCARLSAPDEGWNREGEVRTGLKDVENVASSADGTSAIVSREGDKYRISIWDPKASEFSSGEQFSQVLDEPVVAFEWSPDGQTLALASAQEVSLLCAQRLDDLSGAPSWATYATVRIDEVLPAPISAVTWVGAGLVLSAADHLFFYSSRLSTGLDAHALAASRCAPLPLHHPQLLFQALLQGHFDAVVRILAGLAAELTQDGTLTPVPMREKAEKLTLEAFLRHRTKKDKAANDVFSALTTAGGRDPSTPQVQLSQDDMSRLLAALRKRSLRGLSKLEHEHLAILAQTVFETQSRTGSIDDDGLRYLVSMRSFYLYRDASPSSTSSTGLNGPLVPRLKYRDMLWAFHSEGQDLLLEESTKAASGKLTWEAARTLGLGLWIKSQETLVRTLESVGRTEFSRPGAEDRDPISAMLFYLALRKPHIVKTFWKQATGHSDQRQVLKFLENDFELARWRTAANKNAFVLLSKQRFLFAACFFLLGNSLKDATSVLIRQLDDFQLAIAIARAYEGGTDGPVLRSILEETVIPRAFEKGFRWLGSWAFWMLNRRDLAVQIIVTPLSQLASRLPYKVPVISSPAREDPALVFLFAQLRSWSLQTVKGAIAVPGKTEFNFVLHISRILCRMGCHVLALNLLRTWHFLPPTPPTSSRPALRHAMRRSSLLLSSTKLDLPLPPSNLPSRVASPAPSHAEEEEKAERERQKRQFREVVNTVKVEAKAPAEFSFDAFGSMEAEDVQERCVVTRR
ncbi:regulator of (H+)-ATPase in vacuolar membrane [Rhodotorula kratochvilovae]